MHEPLTRLREKLQYRPIFWKKPAKHFAGPEGQGLMATYLYELQPEPGAPVERGEVDAANEQDAKRQLRVRYLRPSLPAGTRLVDKEEEEAKHARARSAKLRQLLRVLNAHNEWLKNPAKGRRADLSGLDLHGVSLRNTNLSHADLAGADLSHADLRGVTLAGANLVRARLFGANLRNADLTDADLSDADLRESVLTGATLTGADLWRANLQESVISAKALHAALGCRTA
jgi:uncharacterized protein YjbI with pentapeptide repeats